MKTFIVIMPNSNIVHILADDATSYSDRITFVTNKKIMDERYGNPVVQQSIVAEFYFVNIAGWGIAL